MSRVELRSPARLEIGDGVVVVSAITDDSRLVAEGDLFLLLPRGDSHHLDGLAGGYLQQAVERGAAAVVLVGAVAPLEGAAAIPQHSFGTMDEVGIWLRRLLTDDLHLPTCIGVTGTDGKTSITWMARRALQRLHGSSWSLGTLGRVTSDEECMPLNHTTPPLLVIQHLLAEASVEQVKTLLCEVSSHGIAQQRIAGVPFTVALWSSIGRDHLQDHGGMDRYVELKASFMRRVVAQGGVAVANADHALLVTALEGVRQRLFWYGRQMGSQLGDQRGDATADRCLYWRSLAVDRVELQYGGVSTVVEGAPVAEFHHENLAAAAALLLHGKFAELAQLPQLLSEVGEPPGRMQMVAEGVFIDYAHTPEALAALLASARRLCAG
ncbi:MAG: Mur ligase family protein, partial [Mariprofundales bacterium]|nr:Mur ligase family protein [Mariprofundales bacterium]